MEPNTPQPIAAAIKPTTYPYRLPPGILLPPVVPPEAGDDGECDAVPTHAPIPNPTTMINLVACNNILASR